MKIPLLLVVTLFIASASPLRAGDIFLKATVSGTVQTPKPVQNEVRVHTAILNNKRIFQEFLVSQDDYELVIWASGDGSLELLPKHVSSGLPTLSVVTFGNNYQEVGDTKTNDLRYVSDVAPGVATNLFQNLAGEVFGTVHFSGQAGNPINRSNFSLVGHGTDPAGVVNKPALLKFKVTSAGGFTQKP